ncbi:Cytosolic iron-sulfur protein assembly protein [Dimargaris xerosporica]|nr:Cytosolic iron-sulfur protein assembly protein [Dimargaris xerosporica]
MVRLELLAELAGHNERVWQVSWHPSGKLLSSCSGDRTIRLWHLSNLHAPNLAPVSHSAASATANHGQGAAGGGDTLSQTDPSDTHTTHLRWRCVEVLEGVHKRTVRSVAFSPSGRDIASASFDGTTGIWEPQHPLPDPTTTSPSKYDMALDHLLTDSELGYECVAPLEGHENEVKSVAWSHSGNLLATCSRDKSVWVWEVVGDGDFECLSVLQEHTQDVKMVRWHPNKEILASASYDDTIRIWREDDDDWYCSAVLQGHESTVWALDFSPQGDCVVSASDDQSLKFWQCDNPKAFDNDTFGYRQDPTWRCVATIKDAHQRCIYSVSWSGVHDLVASCSGDNTIAIFEPAPKSNDAAFGYQASGRTPKAHGIHDINCVQWNPYHALADILASCGDDGIVRIWRVVQES